MFGPHPVVLKVAVNEYDRFALTGLDIGKLGAVGGNPFDVIGNGHCSDRAADDESSKTCSRKVATRHASSHIGLLLLSVAFGRERRRSKDVEIMCGNDLPVVEVSDLVQ